MHPLPAQALAAALDHLHGCGAALAGAGCRSPPDRYRSWQCEHRKQLSDANPQVPIVDAGNTVIEHADLRQAGSPKDDGARWNEIPDQEAPEKIALRTRFRKNFTVGSVRISGDGLCVNHSGLRTLFKHPDLLIDRTRKPQIIVIQETQVVACTRD